MFVTHGGISSAYETIYSAKPVVCVPFAGDQFHNCIDLEKRGLGIIVQASEITSEILQTSITTILNDDRYTIFAMEERNKMDSNGPKDGSDFVEEIVEKGFEHLIPHYYKLPFYQKWNLDVISVFLVILVLVYYFLKI